jgi:hypothetical protein
LIFFPSVFPLSLSNSAAQICLLRVAASAAAISGLSTSRRIEAGGRQRLAVTGEMIGEIVHHPFAEAVRLDAQKPGICHGGGAGAAVRSASSVNCLGSYKFSAGMQGSNALFGY